MVQSKKVPTDKDLTDSLEKVLLAALTGGFLRNLEQVETQVVDTVRDSLSVKVVPDMIAKLVSGSAPSKSDQAKIITDVMKATQDTWAVSGMKGVLDIANGDESPAKLAGEAVKAVERDTAVRRLLEAEVKAQLKKRKIPVK